MNSDISFDAEFVRQYDISPKQKAEQLIDVFMNINGKKKLSMSMAIESAIKTTDELITATASKFWYDVRRELETCKTKL